MNDLWANSSKSREEWRFALTRRISKIPPKRFVIRENSATRIINRWWQGWWATEWLADRLQLWWRQQLPTNLPTPASGHVICHIKRLAQTASSLHIEGICSYVLDRYRIQRDKLPFFFSFSFSPSISFFRIFTYHFFCFCIFYVLLFIGYLMRYNIICIFKDNCLILISTSMCNVCTCIFFKVSFVLKFSNYLLSWTFI